MNPVTPVATLMPVVQPVIVNVPQQASAFDYIGLAGFLLALALGVFEVYKYWNNRAKLKFRYGFEIEIVGSTVDGQMVKLEPGKTFWSVDISNVGSKDIIFNQICFTHTHTTVSSMLTKDYNGPINRFTLTPGDNHSFTIPNELVNPKKVKEIIVMDATGKVYKKKVIYNT